MSADKISDQQNRRSAKPVSANGPTAAEYRLAQQKAALKANMARRKAQVRLAGDAGTAESDAAATADSNDKE